MHHYINVDAILDGHSISLKEVNVDEVTTNVVNTIKEYSEADWKKIEKY